MRFAQNEIEIGPLHIVWQRNGRIRTLTLFFGERVAFTLVVTSRWKEQAQEAMRGAGRAE